MNDEEIRAPDAVKSEQLLSNDQGYFHNDNEHVFMNQIQDKQLQKALDLSRKEYEKEEQLKQQKILEKQEEEKRLQEEEKRLQEVIEHRSQLTKEFLKRACVLRLSKDQISCDAINYFQDELSKYEECQISKIYLFSQYKNVIDHFLEDMYHRPIQNNKVPRISKEVYDYILSSYELF